MGSQRAVRHLARCGDGNDQSQDVTTLDEQQRRREPVRLAVLISGSGRTLENIADVIDRGELEATIELVVSSRPDVKGIERAARRGIRSVVVPRKGYADAATFSQAIFELVRQAQAELVCLAGFLSLLTVPDDYAGRVINIHPALLPEFGGKGMYGHHVHEAVLAAGRTESGCTVHYADATYDTGKTILQRTCPVLPDDTADTLAARVFEQECLAYPEAIRQLIPRIRAMRKP